MNNRVLLLKHGEIVLKGANRSKFEDLLIANIKQSLEEFKFELKKSQSVIYLFPKLDMHIPKIIKKLGSVFGISQIADAYLVEKEMITICKISLEILGKLDFRKFKVDTRRCDKQFPLNSYEVSCKVGGCILDNLSKTLVDIHNPDVKLNIEIRDIGVFLYTEKYQGALGLPVGSSGKGLLLLSGGIDSPVAGYMMAKRGMKIQALHFHSHPYTSDRAKNKVVELARIVSKYNNTLTLNVCSFTDIQLAIRKYCPPDQLVIIMRRYMMKIADRLASLRNFQTIITGESLGQVASQTIECLNVTEKNSTIPVLRPLIGMDKPEIINIAKKIDTFETSILPFEDCCTVFVPKHPVTKPKIQHIERSEAILESEVNIEELIKLSIEQLEEIVLY